MTRLCFRSCFITRFTGSPFTGELSLKKDTLLKGADVFPINGTRFNQRSPCDKLFVAFMRQKN